MANPVSSKYSVGNPPAYIGKEAPPKVDFIGSPLSGSIPLSVTFTNQTTYNVNSYLWDFGDGQTSTSTNPTHVYSTAGAKTVTLTATGPGGVGSKVRTNYVNPVSTVTTATLSGLDTGTTGTSVTLTVTLDASADQTYTINFSATNGAVLGHSSRTITSGQTQTTTTVTLAADGSTSVDFTVSPSLTRAGRPKTVTFAAAPAPAPAVPATTIIQYMTHDGDSVGNVQTSSAPSATYWNTVLEIPWANADGDWLDANQISQGSTAWATSSALSGLGRYSATVTSLVQRWMNNGQNRGFYLRYSVNAFPVTFAGRTAATDADRPKLTVVTNVDTYVLTARANASWEHGSVSVRSSSDQWTVSSGNSAILQFDLSSVVGAVSSATLAFTVISYTQTGMVVRVFEANPPTLTDPANYTTPVSGIGSGSWSSLQSNGATLFADDWRIGGGLDFSGGNWEVPNNTGRSVDPATGRTKLSAYIASGQLLGASVKKDIVTAASTGGVTQAAQRKNELYARIRLYLDEDFASTVERIKIPAIGCQLGYWNINSGGYWETNQTGGNGGFPATGKKVWLSSINGGAGGWGYSGHSSRLLIGLRASDDSAYSNLVAVKAYIYNLDQVGPFPNDERFPGGTVLQLGRDYEFEFRQKLNTMSGQQDADGNYDTANADGIYQVWINGQLCYDKQTFRWVKHQEFSVQGFWWDVYHGGTLQANANHHFSMGELAMATSQIGASPRYVWAAGLSDNVWTQLSSVPSIYDALETNGVATTGPWLPNNYSAYHQIIDGNGDPAIDPATGDNYFFGGGHGDGSYNGIVKFDVRRLEWSEVMQPTPRAKYPPYYVSHFGLGGVLTYPSTDSLADTPGVDLWPCIVNQVFPGLVADGEHHGGYFLDTDDLSDSADTPYATSFMRTASHTYGSFKYRSKTGRFHMFYGYYGEADLNLGKWDRGSRWMKLGQQAQTFLPGSNGLAIGPGAMAHYDESTDRFFVMVGPSDLSNAVGIWTFNPSTRRVEAIIGHGWITASTQPVAIGRKLWIFTKINLNDGDPSNYPTNGSMNRGLIFDMDTSAIDHFTVIGATEGGLANLGSSRQDTIPTTYDGRQIRRWNYVAYPNSIFSIDPTQTPTGGTGSSGDPYIYTQTRTDLSGSFSGITNDSLIYQRLITLPGGPAGKSLLFVIPTGLMKPMALLLN